MSLLLAERFTAGRFSGQVEWRACRDAESSTLVPRGACTVKSRLAPRSYRRIAAAAEDLRRTSDDSSKAALRGTAMWSLLSDDTSTTAARSAVASLERALRADSTDPGVLNDVAVAYLALAERSQQFDPLLRALDAVERGAARDSLDPAIRFNQALIRQRLYLRESAQRAWARYLARERDPRWRAEAQAHARRIAEAVEPLSWAPLRDRPPVRYDAATRSAIAARVRQSPQGAREISFLLLGEWGETLGSGGDNGAAARLALAREVGNAAVRQGMDPGVALAVRAIDEAEDGSRRLALARAHAEFARGFRQFYAPALEPAAASLARAEDGLRAAGSPAARWAAFYRASAEMNRGLYEAADRRFRTVLAEATEDEQALVGRSIWALGVSQVRRGNHEDASRFYREARPHIARAKEPDNEAALVYLLAESLGLSGQTAAGQAEALRGLRLLSPFRSWIHLNNHLTTVATYARGDGLSHGSLAIMDEVLAVSRSIGNPEPLARAHRARARDLLVLGRQDEARAELRHGLLWAGRMAAGSARDRARADVQLVLAQLVREEDPAASLRILTGVVATYRKGKIGVHLPFALYESGLAAEAAGDSVTARERLREAVEHIHRQQASFESAEVRATFHETVENVFDAVVRTEIGAGRPDSAFVYLERARTAIQPMPGSPGRPARMPALGIARVAARLPPDVLLVDYALLPDQLVVWTASARGWHQLSIPVRRDSVAALVNAFTAELGVADPAPSQARARLYELLIHPLGKELAGARRLVVVPDRELYRVPFAALWDRRTRRYLLEDREVTTVPSATFHAAAAARAHGERRRMSALVVGDPVLDPQTAARLPPLRGAVREAEQVAPMYERRRLLRGKEAERRAVVGLLPSYSVFHFAGHAVFNGEQPGASYLALSADGEGAGNLRAWEIGELSLSNVELAVLSACSTLSPRPSRAGAAAGLAYSFLRAGVPATVSTLWDVDDDATAGVLVDFHRRFSGGASAAESLRHAQLRTLRSTQPELKAPEAWAAFVYTGP